MYFNIRKDAPIFKGWDAINWDNERLLSEDRFVHIGIYAAEKSRYKTPETGYRINETYIGTCSDNWSNNDRRNISVYRKTKNKDDQFISRSSPIPLDALFSQALPLP